MKGREEEKTFQFTKINIYEPEKELEFTKLVAYENVSFHNSYVDKLRRLPACGCRVNVHWKSPGSNERCASKEGE